MDQVLTPWERIQARKAEIANVSVMDNESKPEPQRISLKGHPLADGRGRVYMHRVAAWEQLGPGPHRCFDCGEPVYWIRRLIASDNIPCELRVGALDGDETNTAEGNLKPFCPACLGKLKGRR